MGQSAFGEYGMVQSTVSALGAFSVLGSGLTATRFVAEFRESDPRKVARILRMSWVLSLVSGALVAAMLALFSPLLASRVLAASHLRLPLMLGSIMVLLNAVIAFQNGALAGFEAFRSLARVSFVSGVLSFPLIALGAWRAGVEGAVLGTAASLLVNVLLNGLLLREQYARAQLRLQGAAWREEAGIFWTFSLPAFLASFAVAPALWACNALLVNRPGGYSQMGIYTAADRWRVALLFVPTTVFRMALPMLSNLQGKSDLAGYRRIHRANVLLNLGLVAAPALVLSVLAAPVMSGYGPGFRSGWPILSILAVGTIPEALNTVLGYPLVVGNRMWTRFGFDVLLAATLLSLGAVLIPRWGAVGLATAYVAAFTATAAGLYVVTSGQRRAAPRIPSRAPPTARPG
jgi:O-antigen/teichoic acid export membrane protein